MLLWLAFAARTLTTWRLREWFSDTAMPVIAGVFLLAFVLALPVSIWLDRRENRRRSTGTEAWNARERWGYRIRWQVRLVALLSFILLPFPLFVYSACTLRIRYYGSESPWRRTVIDMTPRFVSEASAEVLSWPAHPKVVDVYGDVLRSGRVSPERLKTELNTSKLWAIREDAFTGLTKTDPEAALDYARRGGQGKIPMPFWMLNNVGRYFGRKAPAHEIEPFLEPVASSTVPYNFHMNILAVAFRCRRHEFISKFDALVQNKWALQADSAQLYARYMPPARSEALFPALLSEDANAAMLPGIIDAIRGIPDYGVQLRIVSNAFEKGTVQSPLIVLLALQGYGGLETAAPADRKRAALAIAPCLDSEDYEVRKSAWFALANILNVPYTLDKDELNRPWTAGAGLEKDEAVVSIREKVKSSINLPSTVSANQDGSN
ncbi:MAG TPA: hypothetical protein VEK08_03750 [Planctomycetota bacterium]|nr:hypothetical protein [Planctomycetota bacterium]